MSGCGLSSLSELSSVDLGSLVCSGEPYFMMQVIGKVRPKPWAALSKFVVFLSCEAAHLLLLPLWWLDAEANCLREAARMFFTVVGLELPPKHGKAVGHPADSASNSKKLLRRATSKMRSQGHKRLRAAGPLVLAAYRGLDESPESS